MKERKGKEKNKKVTESKQCNVNNGMVKMAIIVIVDEGELNC